MPHSDPSQFRKHYRMNRIRNAEKLARKFANMRAEKERKRIDRATREEPIPDLSHCPRVRSKQSGFRVTVECLDDGERASFTSNRTPWGLSISATAAGAKVAAVMMHYGPA